MYYLGVDGGGTKTAFALINNKGAVLERTVKGTCHYRQESFEVFEAVLREGIDELLSKAGITKDQVTFSYLGIPCYGEYEEDIEKLERIVEKIIESKNFKCGNDVESCWAGSLGCRAGVSVIAGTGSIAYGIDSSENKTRSGGWGYFCGDEGSAYWIAKKVMESFGKQADGRLEKTPLYDLVKEGLGLKKDFDFIDITMNVYGMKRDKIAQLSKYAYEASLKNDLQAQKIFEQAAYEQFLMIKAVIEQLDFSKEDKILVSYGGGVFNAGKYVLNPLTNMLKEYNEKIVLIKPLMEPVLGSCLYAYKLAGNKINNEIVNKIKEL